MRMGRAESVMSNACGTAAEVISETLKRVRGRGFDQAYLTWQSAYLVAKRGHKLPGCMIALH